MTTQDMLDERYGRTSSPQRRWTIGIVIAVAAVLVDGTHLPRDLRAPGDDRPPAGTFQFADAVIASL